MAGRPHSTPGRRKHAAISLAIVLACAALLPVSADDTSELDALMARVLERRNETWRALHDYVLSEREHFELIGPSDTRLFGTRREYTWFVRDGYLIRSPIRIDGVTLDESERRAYEARWLEEERKREARKREQDERRAAQKEKEEQKAQKEQKDERAEPAQPPDTATLVARGIEPRFVSEAYFLRFKFEPGNYLLAGRETLDGRDVLRIEYYPSRLFRDDDPNKPERYRRENRDDEFTRDLDRKMNKVSLVTIWVDPREEQIVKYTFENLDFDFLPGRWLVRVTDVEASMTMGQYFGKVWLPRELTIHAGVMLAAGPFDATYRREFLDYRQAETKARIRSYEVP